jgi:PAS domain S-box-containing protein
MKVGLIPNRIVQFSFGAAIVILVLVGAFAYRSMAISSESNRWVQHTYEGLTGLQSLTASMAEMSASIRRFVITGENTDLELYRAAKLDMGRLEPFLRDLTLDNPEQQRRLSVLEKLATARIEQAELIIGLRRNQGLEAAMQSAREEPTVRVTAEYRTIVLEMQREEERLLALCSAAVIANLRNTKIILITGTVLGLLITSVAGWLMLRDRGRRAVTEMALLESERKYRLLIEGVKDCAILMLGPLGEIRSWNPGAERISRCSFEDVAGKNFSRFFPPDDVARGKPDEILRIAAAKGEYDEQGMRVRGDGTRYLARTAYTASHDRAGNLNGFTVISRDLSESAESGAKYRGLMEAAPDAMVVVNQGGEIVLLNVQAEKQFGYRRDELLGQKVTNIIPEGFAERLIADDLRSSEDALAQQIGTGIELSGRRKDRTEFPIELMLSPLGSADGILVTAAIRDISVRKAAEADLLHKVEELNRSNEELGQFAYIASHDLQEPLRMVASYTQLLSRRYKGRLDADADEFIAFAVDGATRMQRLIQDLLAYSRVGTKGRELVNTSSEDALRQALSNLRGAMEESGALVTHDPLPEVMADETQLIQLFQNLVGNAIKYQNHETPKIHIGASNGGKQYRFAIRDNGLGIDPQYFERIFGMFQRLHKREEFSGTGIGLAICKKIVERHGGQIAVESRPGIGSVFSFALTGSDWKSN